MTTPSALPTRLPQLAFGVACGIGLAGAWIGLTYHSFWFDELSGAAAIGDATDLRATMARIAADTTPPLYYVALFYFAKAFGTGDAALRAFSAFFACASIALFVVGTRRCFSLSARLFAAAMATGSMFWFFQSQNARFYTVCLALSAVVLILALQILRSPPQSFQRSIYAALGIVLLLGVFVHYYFTIEGLAVLMVLFLHRRRERLALCLIGAVLVAATLLYLHFVVTPHVQVDPNNFYIPNTFHWYVAGIRSAFHYSLGRKGALAIALCLAAIIIGHLSAKRRPALELDGTDTLIVGVPVLVLVGGIVSSTLFSPNFTDRNLLICSPFLWAIWARLYDWAQQSIGPVARACLALALALVVFWMATIVTLRVSPKESPLLWSEPFRQSAEWIRNVPACRGAVIPVIDLDRKGWYRNDYDQRLFSAIYGRYLQGYATTKIVYLEDIEARRIDPGLADEMRARLAGKGCPIVGWSAHGIYHDSIPGMRTALLAALGLQDAPPDSITIHYFQDGWWGFTFAAGKSVK
ncbi:MAG: glycosyltransferase family 39 protein [Reyranella sp.]|nr:glycosyltransferase family 39 protein [Reyranella sp.]